MMLGFDIECQGTKSLIWFEIKKTDYFKNLASSLNQGNLSSKQWWKVTKQFLKQNKDSDIPILIRN